MTGIKEPFSTGDPKSVASTPQSGEPPFRSKAQQLLLILFVGSTVALLVMWIAWRGSRIVPGVDTPLEVTPTPSQMFWLIVAAATSLASLLGMISNTILGLRKEQREVRAEALERRRQELEIEKLQLELEREKASASKRTDSQRNTEDVPAQPGSDKVDRQTVSSQPEKEPPTPADGERNRLRVQWSELDEKYQDLTRLLAAVDQDLGQAQDSERRLVLQERRDELATQRDAISATMAELERRLAEIGSTD